MAVGPVNISSDVLPLANITKLNQHMIYGRYRPPDCISRYRVAVIVPYREREDHLKVLLHHLLPILTRQQLNFGIYLVEPIKDIKFNRGMLMNIGFSVASNASDYQYFIFHDVDLLPENDKAMYTCPNQPVHLAYLLDKWNYKLIYPGNMGGVTCLSKKDFIKINGFSNKYFGWGGEDDDLVKRVKHAGLKVTRYNDHLGRYHMIKHDQAKKNKERWNILYAASKRFNVDGLNSLKYYNVLQTDHQPLFIRVLVNISESEIMRH